MEKFLAKFGKNKNQTAKPTQERPIQVQQHAEKVSEKRTSDDRIDSEGSAKKRQRVWDDKWKDGRPWLDLSQGKEGNLMICTWCVNYMSNTENARKCGFIKGLCNNKDIKFCKC